MRRLFTSSFAKFGIGAAIICAFCAVPLVLPFVIAASGGLWLAGQWAIAVMLVAAVMFVGIKWWNVKGACCETGGEADS